jgi:hypothetical protein
MARAHTVWLVLQNGKPFKSFTVKHECQSFLRMSQGWNIVELWKMPDGTAPLFAAQKLDIKEFLA